MARVSCRVTRCDVLIELRAALGLRPAPEALGCRTTCVLMAEGMGFRTPREARKPVCRLGRFTPQQAISRGVVDVDFASTSVGETRTRYKRRRCLETTIRLRPASADARIHGIDAAFDLFLGATLCHRRGVERTRVGQLIRRPPIRLICCAVPTSHLSDHEKPERDLLGSTKVLHRRILAEVRLWSRLPVSRVPPSDTEALHRPQATPPDVAPSKSATPGRHSIARTELRRALTKRDADEANGHRSTSSQGCGVGW